MLRDPALGTKKEIRKDNCTQGRCPNDNTTISNTKLFPKARLMADADFFQVPRPFSQKKPCPLCYAVLLRSLNYRWSGVQLRSNQLIYPKKRI